MMLYNAFFTFTVLLLTTVFAVPAPRSNLPLTTIENFNVIRTVPPNFSKAVDVSPATPVISDMLVPGYAHGYCSFHMQLFQQCLYSPSDDWHTEILGNLYSIEDNDRKTAIRFPEGAGRIDGGRIKRLTGMGSEGLYVSYWNDDKVYFRFDGGLWDTSTSDNGNAYGLCQWGAWTKDRIDCGEENAGQYRLSDMTCVFKC